MRCDECNYCHSVDYSKLVPEVICTKPRQSTYPDLYKGCSCWVKRKEGKVNASQHTVRS